MLQFLSKTKSGGTFFTHKIAYLTDVWARRITRHYKSTRCFDDFAFSNSRSHTKRIFASVDSNTEFLHDIAHRDACIIKSSSFARQFCGPHPISAAFNILEEIMDRIRFRGSNEFLKRNIFCIVPQVQRYERKQDSTGPRQRSFERQRLRLQVLLLAVLQWSLRYPPIIETIGCKLIRAEFI